MQPFEQSALLAKHLLGGDKEAYGALYEIAYRPLYHFVYARLGNIRERREVALDLTEDSFYKFLKFISKNTSAMIKPMPFLFTIARNTIIDYARKKKEALIETEEFTFDDIKDEGRTIPAPDEHAELNLLGEKLTGFLSALTVGQQEIISLTYYEGMETKEVAHVLDISEEAVRQQKSRALKALRYLMQRHEAHFTNYNRGPRLAGQL